MMSDKLYNLIGPGTYTIAGIDTHADKPMNSQKHLELDNSVFMICKLRYSSKELAIMESKLTHAQALFSIDVGLKRNTVKECNNVHNIFAIPWEEVKRPMESGESGVYYYSTWAIHHCHHKSPHHKPFCFRLLVSRESSTVASKECLNVGTNLFGVCYLCPTQGSVKA